MIGPLLEGGYCGEHRHNITMEKVKWGEPE